MQRARRISNIRAKAKRFAERNIDPAGDYARAIGLAVARQGLRAYKTAQYMAQAEAEGAI